jgi:hypothetical protein
MSAAADDGETFIKARQNIAEQLTRLTFSVVTRDVAIPEDSRETCSDGNISVKYYHGTAEERNVSMSYRERPKSIWFNKSKRMRDGFSLGPTLIAPIVPDGIPTIGDWLVGLAESAPPPRGAHAAAKRHSGLQYISWTPNAKPLYEMARMFLSSQELAMSESAMRQKLRTTTEHGEDELYALVLLVLLGDIAAFDPTKKKALDVRKSYANFVQDCTIRFNDDSIWKKYVHAYPSVLQQLPLASVRAVPPPPVVPPHPLMTIPGFSLEALKSLSAAAEAAKVARVADDDAPMQYATPSLDELNAAFFGNQPVPLFQQQAQPQFQPPLPPAPPPPPSLDSLAMPISAGFFTPVSPDCTPPASPPYKPGFDYGDVEF